MNAQLINVAAQIVAIGAREYMNAHNLRAEPAALESCCKAWLAIKLPEALRDAKAALECGMGAVAEQTFKASLIQAGIEAAKEAGLPAYTPPEDRDGRGYFPAGESMAENVPAWAQPEGPAGF